MRTLLLFSTLFAITHLGCGKKDKAADQSNDEHAATTVEALVAGHNYEGAQAAFKKAGPLILKAKDAELDVSLVEKKIEALREEFETNSKEYLELTTDSPGLDWFDQQFWNSWIAIEEELNHLRYALEQEPAMVHPDWSSPQFDHPDSDRRLLTERDYDQTKRVLNEDAEYFIGKAKESNVETSVAEQILAATRASFEENEAEFLSLPDGHDRSAEFAKRFWENYAPLQMELNYLRTRSNPTPRIRPPQLRTVVDWSVCDRLQAPLRRKALKGLL